MFPLLLLLSLSFLDKPAETIKLDKKLHYLTLKQIDVSNCGKIITFETIGKRRLPRKGGKFYTPPSYHTKLTIFSKTGKTLYQKVNYIGYQDRGKIGYFIVDKDIIKLYLNRKDETEKIEISIKDGKTLKSEKGVKFTPPSNNYKTDLNIGEIKDYIKTSKGEYYLTDKKDKNGDFIYFIQNIKGKKVIKNYKQVKDKDGIKFFKTDSGIFLLTTVHVEIVGTIIDEIYLYKIEK